MDFTEIWDKSKQTSLFFFFFSWGREVALQWSSWQYSRTKGCPGTWAGGTHGKWRTGGSSSQSFALGHGCPQQWHGVARWESRDFQPWFGSHHRAKARGSGVQAPVVYCSLEYRRCYGHPGHGILSLLPLLPSVFPFWLRIPWIRNVLAEQHSAPGIAEPPWLQKRK